MRAKLLNEKFDEKGDPIIDMGIGVKNNPKVVLPLITKKLKDCGLKIEWHTDRNLGSGFYYATIELEFIDDNYVDNNDKYPEIQINYTTDKAANSHGYDGGFQVADEGGEIVLDSTHNIDEAINVVLKFCYVSKEEIKRRLKEAQKKIIQANKEIGFYQKTLAIL